MQTQTTTDVYFDLDRDGLTGGFQLCVGDEHGGFRIFGPKYCGQSKRLYRYKVTEEDVKRIRGYLDRAFPTAEDHRDATIQALAAEVERLATDLETSYRRETLGMAVQWNNARCVDSAAEARALLSRLGARP